MKRLLLIIFAHSILTSCQTSKLKLGNYISICSLYDKARVELILSSDNYFKYNFAYHYEIIEGTWQISKDTVILYSKKFTEKREPLTPAVKNSDLDSLDKYLIRGKKLYVINKEGRKKHCYLVRAKQ